MDAFAVHRDLIDDYAGFTSGFIDIHDERVRRLVEEGRDRGEQWPDPYLALNPNFASGGTITDLVAEGLLDPTCDDIFRAVGVPLELHRHQRQAVEQAREGHDGQGQNYVLTTGTGSGKSLGYLIPIVDHVLRLRRAGAYRPGVKAIVVYTMNALANSQRQEMEKFLGADPARRAVSFDRYTGQEGESERARIRKEPPDVLLTNDAMLELLLTRRREREALIAGRPACGSSSSTSSTPTAAVRVQTWRCWSDGFVRPAVPRRSGTWAPPPR